MPVALPPPALVTPGPNEVSFGRFAGRVARGTQTIVVTIDGRVAAKRDLCPGRVTFDFHVALPPRDVRLTVTSIADQNRRASTAIAPVFGLPRAAEPRAPPRGYEDARLGRAIRGLASRFSGICGIYVQDLRTGAGAAWNARAQLPAASTLKVAIAVEVLRVLDGQPARLQPRRSPPTEDALSRPTTRPQTSCSSGSADRRAAGRLESTRRFAPSASLIRTCTAAMRYQARQPIPLRRNSEPSFVGKRTTAWDFARLLATCIWPRVGRGGLHGPSGEASCRAKRGSLLYLSRARDSPTWLDRTSQPVRPRS